MPKEQELTAAQKRELLALLEERERREKRNKFKTLYPDTGRFRRDLYPGILEFFKLGLTYNERALFGGNRTGKTVGACYELVGHLTGAYAPWWPGRRFNHPTDWWAAGNTAKTVRNILQAELLGPPGDPQRQGTGLIPADTIIRTTPKHGIAEAVETVYIKHVSGGTSELQFLSTDQGRIAFQGTSRHGILLDEDVPQEVYVECLMRLLTTNGMIIWSATLVEGITPLMLDFLPHMKPLPDVVEAT